MMAANLAEGHGSASGRPVCSKHCKKMPWESSPDGYPSTDSACAFPPPPRFFPAHPPNRPDWYRFPRELRQSLALPCYMRAKALLRCATGNGVKHGALCAAVAFCNDKDHRTEPVGNP